MLEKLDDIITFVIFWLEVVIVGACLILLLASLGTLLGWDFNMASLGLR